MSARAAAARSAAAGLAVALPVGAALAGALARRPPGGAQRWRRTNHRGEVVTLLEGPAVAGAGAAAALAAPGVPARWRLAAAGACAGGALFGAVDDLAERSGERDAGARGLRGHFAALRRGRVTTGAVKVLGLGVTGALVAATAAGPRGRGGPALGRVLDVATGAAVVAGCANLLNLFDLRPGRALKVVLLASAALAHPPASPEAARAAAALAGAAAGAAAAALPADLAERSMLGDTGANALGALLGTVVLARCGARGRLLVLGGVTALTLASERVSFSKVIAATPGLRELDALGRRPAG
ncbi:hypothetical protein CLV92_12238 [Kineococcus xinjiangensis]|uniref:UDP-N-acetylmuramyl pentapeptide phosphotransferase/UDP-N-acetylglucosamine-1-phosphate transferase n=1 Tax=Kineococcus xinjiangensis TaxID=512762 RepID=A0A2S6IC86_9ACTN|nr:hypothetical protein [Kineococcus xinjiangensis]PPK90862.1 hypothetical protein CLV92_12238 [Kineococcus xinjiangensis]